MRVLSVLGIWILLVIVETSGHFREDNKFVKIKRHGNALIFNVKKDVMCFENVYNKAVDTILLQLRGMLVTECHNPSSQCILWWCYRAIFPP